MKKNKNIDNEDVTIYSIAAEYERVERWVYKKNEPKNDVFISKGFSDKENLFPIINLLSTAFNETHSKDGSFYIPEENLISLINEKAITLLGFPLKLEASEPIFIIDPYSKSSMEIDSLSQIIALLMLSRTSNKKKSNSIVEMDFFLAHLNNFLEEGLKSNGYWKSNSYISDASYMWEFYHSIYTTAIMQIKICPMKSPELLRPSDNDFGIHGVESLLELAWAEMFVANINRIKFSLCPCCGKTYSLEGTGKWQKMTCNSEDCKKKFRYETEQRKRRLDKESVQANDRFRQAKKRAIHAILDKKRSIEEEAKKLNVPTAEIEKWIYEYKAKKRIRTK